MGLMPLTGIVLMVLTVEILMKPFIINYVRMMLEFSVKYLQEKGKLDG